MKFIKRLIFLMIIVIFLAALAAFIFVKTFDINRYRGQIKTSLETALQREVDFGNIQLDISLSRGLTCAIQGFVLKDDPAFSAQPLLRVSQMGLTLDLREMVEKRKLSFSRVYLSSPELSLVRDKAGLINVQALLAALEQGGQAPDSGSGKGKDAGQDAPIKPDFQVDAIEVTNGIVHYLDQTLSPDQELMIREINLKVNNLSSRGKAEFSGGAALLSSRPNVQVTGYFQPDLEKGSALFENVQGSLDLAALDMKTILGIVPQIGEFMRTEKLDGSLQWQIQKMEAGGSGLGMFSLSGNLNLKQLLLTAINDPIEDLAVDFVMDLQKVALTKISCRVLNGEVSGNAGISNFFIKPAFNTELSLKTIDLGALAKNFIKDVVVAGEASGRMTGNASGFLPQQILDSISGGADFNVQGGRLVNVNVLRLLLDKISLIPQLYEKVAARLPDAYKDAMVRNDTIFKDFNLLVKAQPQGLILEGLTIVTDAFQAQIKGQMDWKSQLDLNASVTLPADLSSAMAGAVNELGAFTNTAGEIYIPFYPYQGPAQDLKMFPDLEYLGKRMVAYKGKRELEKVLDDVFGSSEEASTGETPPEGMENSTETPREVPVERQIIEGILDTIFK